MPREGVEIDTAGFIYDVAQAVGKTTGQHLFDDFNGLIQIVARGNGGSNFLAIFS
jgi:hypothetical protein